MNGILTCAKYAFAPNKLKYCGPEDRNKEIFDYCLAGVADQRLENLLRKFEVLYPYLKLIAASNEIADPFDWRVVEAYWIGNELLENVKSKSIYNHLLNDLDLKRRYDQKSLELIFGKVAGGARVHHSHHVLNVFKRVGIEDLPHTVTMMENCIISWGKIIKLQEKKCQIDKPRLSINGNKLTLVSEKVVVPLQLGSAEFVSDLKVGDWVSMHWGWLCDKLTSHQVKNLAKYTRFHIDLANRTL